MFLGTHAPKLDDKGRVILPAKFRAELASGLVLTRGQLYTIPLFLAGVVLWFWFALRKREA